MCAWGGGLYDSDYARDLQALIDGVWRAPLSDEELLVEVAPRASADPQDVEVLDHWLILADQLERRGLPQHGVFERARAIMEAGEDVAALERLNATASAIAKRRKGNVALLERLRSPRTAKKRRPLTHAQPLLLEAGEAIAWPTDKGRIRSPSISDGFKQDGWGFGIVSDAGHLYGVLAYHSVQALKWRRPERPSEAFAVHCPRSEHQYGTITPSDVQSLGIERLGAAPVTAFGPPLEPESGQRDARRAALHGPYLPQAFGLDAFDNSVWPGPKFMFLAPSGTPLEPNEPDQRPGMFDEETEFSALPPDRPASRQHYFNLMRAQGGQ